MVIYHDGYDSSITEFDTRLEADEYLFKQVDHRPQATPDYRLIEFTQEFDVATAVDCHRQKREDIREQALMKLSDEEISVLGLVKP
jgi:hypothetical protein